MKRLRLFPTAVVGLLLVIELGLAVLPTAAQDSSDAALQTAVQFLSKQLGKQVTGEGYTYEAGNYPDSSLGCPKDGVTYKPGPFDAYKFMIPVTGTNYDVRVSLDGKITVLCTALPTATPTLTSSPTPRPTDTLTPTAKGAPSTNTPNSKAVGSKPADSTLAIYRNQSFSLAYPTSWRVAERLSGDTFFGPGNSPACGQPGMIGTPVGSLINKETADDLLDEYLKSSAAAGASLQGDRVSIGNTGRSLVYIAPCADGTARESRVTIFVAYGSAYRIWQFAPQADYPNWAPIFLQSLDGFSPATVNSGANGGSALTPPSRTPLEMLAHIFAGNIYTGTLTDLPGTFITQDGLIDRPYRGLAISPKGQNLAYIAPDGSLYSVAVKDSVPRKLADKLAPGFPVTWSPDGSEVAYLADNGAPGDTGVDMLMAVKADGSGDPRTIGATVPIKRTCQAQTSDPAERLYWSASGPGGNSVLLTWASSGTLYYSLGCDGIGIAQQSASGGASAVINPGLRRISLSPDGTELLGLTVDQTPALVRVKLDDGSSAPITTQGTPDQVAWSADGKVLFYSTFANSQPLALNDETQRERGMKAFGVWPFQSNRYDVTLHEIDLVSGVDSSLYKTTARAVTQIAPSRDGSGLVFVLVQDASNLVEAFQNNVAPTDLEREVPTSLLYWLPLPSGPAQLVAVTLDPQWGPRGSAPAPTATGNPKKINITPNVPRGATAAPAATGESSD